jgi:hypothetical protein
MTRIINFVLYKDGMHEQEVVDRTNTEVSSQTGGAVAEFMRVEDLADIAYQPSLCVSNSNFFKV